MIDWWWTLAAIPPGAIIGWCSCEVFQKRVPPSEEQVKQYMARVVNQEEMEEQARIRKFNMAKNGRTTVRLDGGPNAVVSKAKLRPVVRRFRNG